MTINDLKDLSKQADELGLAQFVISGGEPLTFDNLDEIILALNPPKFNIAMSTNGLLLDKTIAKHLKEMGVDKLKISLDSIDENVYEKTRGQKKVIIRPSKHYLFAKKRECRQWFKLSCHIKPAGRMPLKN